MPVRTSIITGTLGCGKTSLIVKLAQLKPPEERWAVLVCLNAVAAANILHNKVLHNMLLEDFPFYIRACNAIPIQGNVNEFGALGIDAALLESPVPGITVRQLAGGCLCCQAAGMLVPAIAQLLRQVKPDRLIIEPSGLGHPVGARAVQCCGRLYTDDPPAQGYDRLLHKAVSDCCQHSCRALPYQPTWAKPAPLHAGLMQAVQSEHLGPSIRLQAVVCLVDIRAVDSDSITLTDPVALDQVNVCDVIVGTKADLCSEEQVHSFHQWAEALWPPKTKVLRTGLGTAVSLADVLDSPREPVYTPLISSAPSARRRQQQRQQSVAAQSDQGPGVQGAGTEPATESAEAASDSPAAPSPGRPLQYQNTTAQHHTAVGYLFHPEDVFREGELAGVLQGCLTADVVRLKGVFRLGPKRWASINWVAAGGHQPGAVELSPSAYTKDSRCEVICQGQAVEVFDRQGLETALLALLK